VRIIDRDGSMLTGTVVALSSSLSFESAMSRASFRRLKSVSSSVEAIPMLADRRRGARLAIAF
jgi:hypothetical protein